MGKKRGEPTILIVDDEAINLRILAQGLSDQYRVLMADTGQRAIDLAQKELPDLVLLDIELPDLSGYTVLQTLKNDPTTKTIPIIFATGYDSDESEVTGLQMGAADYFTKPINMPLAKVRIAMQIDLKRKTDLLETLVDLDGLTGIPNRRNFDKRFDEEWRRAKREDRSLAVCMADIDFFKPFNDNYGHASGDIALKKVASMLSKTARRAGDYVARYGGEEFVLLLPDATPENAREFLEKLRSNVENLNLKHEFSQCAEHVTLSFGVAVGIPEGGLNNKRDMLKTADKQLYLAKEQGRNRVVLTEMSWQSPSPQE